LDPLLLLKAAVMGVVEGLTEFLPVSSTGHLILAGQLMDFTGEKAKLFEVVIQTGAIVAILALYAQKIRSTLLGLGSDPAARRLVANVLIGFFPAALVGFLAADFIKSVLFSPLVVAGGFIVGGVVILWAEQGGRADRLARLHDVDALRWPDALKVGLVQCLALIPGTSRSGATIIGGMLLGLSRKTSTEFSFFLAIPMIFGAAGYDLLKHRSLLHWQDWPLFAVGLLVSFVAAWVCVRWLLRYVATHTYTAFGWYRIAFGIVIMLTAAMGWVDWGAGR
jgi:undecaprenyl-diphosphatase